MKTSSSILRGSIGGLVGAVVMGSVMFITDKTGLLQKLRILPKPMPSIVENRLEQKLGLAHKTNRPQETLLTVGTHFMIGAGYGASYGLLRRFLRLPALVMGLLYGIGTYASSDLFSGPAVGITPKPKHESSRTIAWRLFVHVVYGVSLALAVEALQKRAPIKRF